MKELGPSRSWIVSFGDLLTLLLCFFITILAQTPLLTPHEEEILRGKSITTVNLPMFGEEELKSARARLSGTSFAQIGNVENSTEVSLSEKELQEAESANKKLLESFSEIPAEIEITTCGPSTMMAVERGEVIRRILNASVLAQSIRTFRYIAGDCREIRNEKHGDTVAVLRGLENG